MKLLALLMMAFVGLSKLTPVDSTITNNTPCPSVSIEHGWFEAAKSGDLQGLKLYLDENPSLLNARDVNGNTAINLADQNQRCDAISWLVQKKADTSITNKHNLIPLKGYGEGIRHATTRHSHIVSDEAIKQELKARRICPRSK
jgi:hypothetical protein